MRTNRRVSTGRALKMPSGGYTYLFMRYARGEMTHAEVRTVRAGAMHVTRVAR